MPRWRRPDLTPDEVAALDQIDALHEVEAIHGSWSHADRLAIEEMLRREVEGGPAPATPKKPPAASPGRSKGRGR